MGFFDKLKNWLNPEKIPDPDSDPDSEPTPKPTAADYLRVWRLLKDIDIQRLWPALLSVPIVVFFTLTGVVVWVCVIIGLILRIIKFSAGV